MESLTSIRAAHYAIDLWKFGLGALALTAILFPFYINWLKKLRVKQYLREEGPASHSTKAHTPTGGGVIMMIVMVALSTYWMTIDFATFNVKLIVVILWGLSCGAIGLIDDMAKLKNQSNKGLSARVRLFSELAIGFFLSAALLYWVTRETGIQLPGFNLGINNGLQMQAWLEHHHFQGINNAGTRLMALPAWLFLTFGSFLTAATTNAFNLHDGMDGLAAGTSIQVFLAMTIMFYATGQPSMAFASAIVAGTLAGFMIFNKYPARIFMGDTGSLFIGGIMSGLVIAGGIVLWFIPLALIYILEALSVIIQVSYFKLTKEYKPEKPMSKAALAWYKLTHRLPGEGKRIFRMAPLHHHFEAVLAEEGVKEWQVVAGFWFFELALVFFTISIFTFVR